jgi:hypothetical protein
MKRAIKLDSNQAWREAAALVMANRELLLTLAGVFFLVPRLAFALFMAEPPKTSASDPVAMAQAMEDYYLATLPFLLPMLVMQAVGTLGMLGLMGDRGAPTVGQALMQGIKGGATYIAAQIIMVVLLSVLGGTVIGVASISGQQGILLAAVVLVVIGLFYLYLRTTLTAPVIAVERQRNPWAALRQSWRLTKGNVGRLLGFMGMAALLAAVAIYAGFSISGVIGGLLGGPQAAHITAAVVSSLLTAVAAVYLCAMLTACYHQLSGETAETPRGVW